MVTAQAAGRHARAPQLWEGAVAVRDAASAARGGGDAADAGAVAFLVPALGAATSQQVAAALPALLAQLDDAALAKAFRRAVAAHAAAAHRTTTALSAADLLVQLHRLPEGAVPMKRLNDALNVCLSARDVFGPLALRDALDRMLPAADAGAAGLATVPKPFLRTCILAVKTSAFAERKSIHSFDVPSRETNAYASSCQK